MAKKSKNNFSKPENIAHCKYRLFMKYKPEYAHRYKANKDGIKYHYGYMTDSDQGYNRLMANLVNSRQGEYHIAMLYDNQNKQLLEVFPKHLEASYLNK